jgi:hypothetical protein
LNASHDQEQRRARDYFCITVWSEHNRPAWR